MNNLSKRIIASALCTAMLFLGSCGLFGNKNEDGNNQNIPSGSGDNGDMSNYIIKESDIPLRLWYDEEAPITGTENNPIGTTVYPLVADDSWEEWSIPIGNGYFGANLFGRTETERIQISEKTITNPNEYINDVSIGGLNNFSETYIDFGHKNSDVSNYSRYLDLKTAVSGVSYVYDGVEYTREYFTSYPDKAIVIRLDASEAGALSFTLRPTIPYEQNYMTNPGDGLSKHGTVTSSVENGVGTIELSGKMGYYDIDFLGIYKVYVNGGSVEAATTKHTYKDTAGVYHTDTDGTIEVSGATSAYIVITLGTDYELSEEIFTSDAELNNCLGNDGLPTYNRLKPTFKTNIDDTREKVEAEMYAISDMLIGKSFDDGYSTLKSRHIEDYSELFGRVTLDLDCDPIDMECTTDELLYQYQLGYYSHYLEVLLFQYGRYMLIASSRPGTLPAHLQGVWNTYNSPPWSSNYTHNINVQMNYWPAFSTNLAETFEAYVDFNQAYMTAAESWADLAMIWNDATNANKDGGNGWVLGHTVNPYKVTYDHSPGNLGLTTQMFWDYYEYTMDGEKLEEVVYPILYSAAQFITKMVIEDENGNYLVANCDSPEQFVNGEWYYTTGTTYAQSFCYLNNYHLLLAAKELGIDLEDNSVLSKSKNAVLKTVLEQIDKYDPIIVGLSGQVKEFREEEYYGDLGEYEHRHISQAVGLFPGNIVNSTTPAWIDAMKVTLTERGHGSDIGWSYAYKVCAWARGKDGDEAYSDLNAMIIDGIAPNLWDLTFGYSKDIFQIEANFGATAGIAEFLLQSEVGYIEPLAALPTDWQTGSYTGLVARGNFEVSAAWENGTAKTFNILSKSGGKLSLCYPSIEGATVCTGDGETVNYTVDGKNLISFDTEVGKTYVIYGFKAQTKPDAPKDFDYEILDNGEFVFEWSFADDAEKYNLYVAVESQPDYTLIGSTTDNCFAYNPEDENSRMTFVVTAVSSDLVESDRTICYFVPETGGDNILKGKTFVGAPGTNYDTNDGLSFSYSKLTDGDFGQNYGNDNWKYGRFSTLPNGHADGTVNLGGSYVLNELRIYCFEGNTIHAGTNFTLQVYSNGSWINLFSNLTNEQLAGYAVNNGYLNNQRYIKLDLGGIKAEKIRFYSDSMPGTTVTWYEIECSGYKCTE